MPPIHGLHGMAFMTEEKEEAFDDSLKRQCTLNYANADVDHIGRRTVMRILDDSDDEDIFPASPEEATSSGRPPTSMKSQPEL